MSHTKGIGSERGVVLVIVLLIMGLLSAVAAGTLLSGQIDLRISANLKTRTQAFYIAEAGLHRAWQEMADGDGTDDFEAVFSARGTTRLFTNMSFSRGSYAVTAWALSGSNPKRIKVTSTGCQPAGDPCPSGNSKVVTEAQFKRALLFPCAVCGRDSVSLSGGAKTDSFDSRVAPYDALTAGSDGDVGSNGAIILSGSTTQIRGDATAGGAVSIHGGATVTGTATNNARLSEFPSVTPCGPPYSSGSGITGGSYNSATGELRGTGGDVIVLADGSYCFSSVTLGGGSTLTVNGPVTINVTADSDFTGGGVTSATAIAENLKIFSSLASSSQGIRVSGGGQAHMAIYAPDARLEVVGGSDIFGSVVGKIVESAGGVRFHYDKRLEDNQDGGIVMVTWVELF